MLRKHFIMSGGNKPDFTITYHAPKHVPFFGGYAKDWVYGYPSYGSGITIDENPIKFKVIGDKWNNGVGEWKFKLEDSSNRIYNSAISEKKLDNLDNLPSDTVLGYADLCLYSKTDENGNIITEESVDNTNIITSVIFGEGIEIINGSVLESTDDEGGQSSCTAITLPESVTLLTGNLFNNYTSLRTITVPLNVIRIDNLCDGDSLEEVVLKPLTPPDASNTSEQNPLGVQNSGENSSKIRVYADCIDVYKNDSIWGQYSDLYDTINNTIVYYNGEDRKLYTENLDITSIDARMLPKSITNVYLPNSVTSIGLSAFYNTGLTSVVIPNSVNSIGNSAFSDCTGLTSIIIGNSVTSIGERVFSDCLVLTSIIVDENNPKYDSREDCNAIIETETNTLILGCNNTIIPNSVTSVGKYAFYYCTGLTSIVIGNSVTNIDKLAFPGCSGLTSVVWNAVNHPNFSVSSYGYSDNPFNDIRTQITSFEFGDSVEHIPAHMCKNMSNLTSVEIPNSVTSIGSGAFDGCTGLTSVVWNAVNCSNSGQFNDARTQIISFEFGDSVEHIPGDICEEMSNLTSVVIPNSVTSIGRYAFSKCTGLTSVEIGDSVTSIGEYAFRYCSGLTSVEIPDSVTSIGESAFLYCTGLTSITIPNLVTSIGNSVFSGCSGLTSVVIPNSVTSIGDWAFSGCSGLTSVVIPNSVTSIGSSAFSGCSSLTSITIPNSVTSIKNGAFFSCSGLTSVEIPNTITSIDSYAFSRCSGLTSIIIPNSVTSIYSSTFEGCSGLTSIIVDENNPKYDSRDNCNAIIETETNTLIYGCKNTIIPNSVTIINLSAFEGSGLTSITIPDSITNILIMAFSGCSELTSIIVDESNPKYDSRDNCNAIIETESNTLISGCKNTIIPDSVTSIGYDAFYNCYGLTLIIIPNSVTYIESGAFEGSDLTSVVIPDSVTYIGSGAFSNCLGLTSVVWNAVNCSDFSSYNPPFYIYNEEDGEEIQIITSFEFGDSVEHIPAYICLNMSNLTSITIPNSVTSIGDYAFSNCSGLTSVEIGNSVNSIGDYVFNGCTGLTSITIPDSVTSIGVAAFLKCGITSITIPNSVTSIENGAFYYCSVLTSVEIGNSVTSIGAAAFGYCAGLTSITIPDSITSIGMAAFGYCTGLTSVTISSIVPPSLGSSVFTYTSSNLIIYVPDDSVDTYKNAANWSSYSSKIKPISEKPV